MRCSKVVHASVTNVRSRCGGKGNTLLIGYSFDQTEEILPLIHVCYDEKEGKTLFTQHMLYGNELKCKIFFKFQMITIFYRVNPKLNQTACRTRKEKSVLLF